MKEHIRTAYIERERRRRHMIGSTGDGSETAEVLLLSGDQKGAGGHAMAFSGESEFNSVQLSGDAGKI